MFGPKHRFSSTLADAAVMCVVISLATWWQAVSTRDIILSEVEKEQREVQAHYQLIINRLESVAKVRDSQLNRINDREKYIARAVGANYLPDDPEYGRPTSRPAATQP